jgi:uncharacterized protein (TIGR02246 family)
MPAYGRRMPTTTDSQTVVERYIDGAQSGDIDALRAIFAENASWRLAGDLPISGTWQGRDAILDDFLALAMRYYQPGSVRLEVTNILVEGDQVVVEWTSRARNRAGEPYENFCIGVFIVRDGKIQAVREYMDTLYAHETAFSRVVEAAEP